MKNLASVAGLALIGSLLFSSCKKEYTCTCTIGNERIPVSLGKVSHPQAKTTCSAMEIGGATDCSLD